MCGALAAGLPGAPAWAETFIVREGASLGQLYLPVRSGRATQFAARELREHLAQMTGAELETAWRAWTPKDGGYVLAIRPESEWQGKEPSQAFTIEERETPQPVVEIAGNSDLAVLYGVYEYLGSLGVRWFTPGEIGAVIPRTSGIPIRPGKRAHAPAFLARALGLSSTPQNHFGGTGAGFERAVTDYQLYLVRNRVHLGRHFQDRFAFNISGTGSGHTVKPMTGLTRDQVAAGLMETAPERFALVTGSDFVQKRRYEDGQVCFSHEENIRTAISNCVSHFERLDASKDARGSDLDELATVAMGLSDCWGICECDACRRTAGAEPQAKDRLVWSFWNRIARGLGEKMPGRMIAVHAPYMDLTQPPPDVKIEPNVMVETPLVFSWDKASSTNGAYRFPSVFLEQVVRTRDAGATLGCYNYLNFPWSPTPLHILDAARLYADLGYRSYHLEAMQRTEYTWPIIWSLARFTWDGSRSPRAYLEEFCDGYYGEPHGRDVLWILDDMTQNASSLLRINFGSSADTAALLPDESIRQGRGRLRNALRVSQGRHRERLRRFQVSIEAQYQLAETYRAFCQALNERNETAIDEFRKRANALKDFWRQNDLEAISTTSRTPEQAADLFLKTDFAALKPAARGELQGKGPSDRRWMQELFAGAAVPEMVPDLFALPEVWSCRIDPENRGMADGYADPDYDDRVGWQPLSSWNYISSQGYGSQIGGHFWYRLRFTPPAFPPGRRILLRIGSLDDSGDVFLNGVRVGSQPDANDWDKSFAMDVTETLKPGAENILAVHGFDSGGGEGVWRPSALYTGGDR